METEKKKRLALVGLRQTGPSCLRRLTAWDFCRTMNWRGALSRRPERARGTGRHRGLQGLQDSG